MQSQRQPSPKSSALERTVKDKCKDENHEKLHKLMDKTTGGQWHLSTHLPKSLAGY